MEKLNAAKMEEIIKLKSEAIPMLLQNKQDNQR